MTILIILLYLIPIVAFVLVIVHILDAIYKYTQKERPTAYYKDLERYGQIVLVYFSIWILAAQLPGEWNFPDAITLGYIFVLPWFIAAYYWKILRSEYHEEIEKLIF